ncbi:hypothetical protein [Mesorhizobium sp. B2-3-4]|uniref:hypothetical protein n=1 Tax=Mesorhizobium sp. B2-3-4 TaxID=2589959 RepID=UPI00112AD75A|nr:hypothetical protein [Mesorhizobium sp. B2-3-4]TPM41804.1 hypothetical protein FJ967_02430 [Mesorhizobium sp. B2-3-4]
MFAAAIPVLLGAAILGTTVPSAFALDIPRGDPSHHDTQFGGAREYEKHLAGYGNVAVSGDGKASAWALFTSELKLQGTRDVALTTTLWAGGAVVATFPFDAHLSDAILHGGHVKERRQIDFALTKEQWSQVTKITYEFTRKSTMDCALLQQKWREGILFVDPKVLGCN